MSNVKPRHEIRNPKLASLLPCRFPLLPHHTSGLPSLIPAWASPRVFCHSCLIDFARLRDRFRANKVDSVWVSPWRVTLWIYTVAISGQKVVVRSRALPLPSSCHSRVRGGTRPVSRTGKERLREGAWFLLRGSTAFAC